MGGTVGAQPIIHVAAPACTAFAANGKPCRMRPMQGESFCFSHHPEHRAAAQAARQLGGIRRRRERAVAQTYDVGNLHSADMDTILRVAEIAILAGLELDNSVQRVRVLLAGCTVLLKVREFSDLEERLAQLEAVLQRSRKDRRST